MVHNQNKLKKPIKKKKVKRQPEYRTREERSDEVKVILNSLYEFGINQQYDAIKELYKYLKEYIDNGGRITFKIPFPEAKRDIVGVLPTNKKEKANVILKYLK